MSLSELIDAATAAAQVEHDGFSSCGVCGHNVRVCDAASRERQATAELYAAHSAVDRAKGPPCAGWRLRTVLPTLASAGLVEGANAIRIWKDVETALSDVQLAGPGEPAARIREGVMKA